MLVNDAGFSAFGRTTIGETVRRHRDGCRPFGVCVFRILGREARAESGGKRGKARLDTVLGADEQAHDEQRQRFPGAKEAWF